jgi:hypothetical protein
MPALKLENRGRLIGKRLGVGPCGFMVLGIAAVRGWLALNALRLSTGVYGALGLLVLITEVRTYTFEALTLLECVRNAAHRVLEHCDGFSKIARIGLFLAQLCLRPADNECMNR